MLNFVKRKKITFQYLERQELERFGRITNYYIFPDMPIDQDFLYIAIIILVILLLAFMIHASGSRRQQISRYPNHDIKLN